MTTTDPTAPATPAEARKRVEDAKRHLFARIIASAHLLDTPFTNAPDQSPWTRMKQAMGGLTAALVELDAARATDPAPAACSHCGGTGSADHPLVPTTICEDCKGTGVGEPAPATPPEPGARTYELPAEPPPEVTELWEVRTGRRWERQQPYGWCRDGQHDDATWCRWPWFGLLDQRGPLSTTPPAGTDPASATAVDPAAGAEGERDA